MSTTVITARLRGVGWRRRWLDGVIQWVIYLAALGAISLIVLIFVFVGREALPVLTRAEVHEEVTLETLFLPQNYGTPEAPLPYVWQPVSELPKYSLMPLLVGTLKVTLVAMLFATPLAILAAIYTTEFAPRGLREAIKPVVEMVAGIPSVVLGFFALIVLANWLQDAFGFDFRLNAINAGIALGLAVIPIIYTLSEDALTAVPRGYRNASYALGASPRQTAWRVVLPAALPGVFAGVVLGFGRAVGETMIVLMASGNAAITSWNFSEPVRTLSATIAAELGEVVFGSPHYHVLFFIGTLLFALTFVLNWLGAQMVERLHRHLAGAER
ncbi:MAG: phosphate ABC transporter permease subunit PstC [Terriglobia bacterium]